MEACDGSLEPCKGSPSAEGAVVSHEAVYTWIYALPKGELARHGIMLRSKRTRRRPRRPVGQRTHPIVGMVSIDDRPEDVDDRRVPGHWEGDLIIGNRWHFSGSDPGRAHHPVRDDSGSTRWGRNT